MLLYSRRDLTLIGRLLTKTQPQQAADLLSTYQAEAPHDRDLTNIPFYFLKFCHAQGLEAEALAFSRYSTEMVDRKKVFIGCIIKIYSPSSFVHSTSLKWGLVRRIAAVLNHPNNYVSELVARVISSYKVYDDFCDQVDTITEKMKGGTNG